MWLNIYKGRSKVGKIKCKKIFWFIFCFLFFIILDISKVSASGEYEVSVNKIENLFYGNYLKDSYIKDKYSFF